MNSLPRRWKSHQREQPGQALHRNRTSAKAGNELKHYIQFRGTAQTGTASGLSYRWRAHVCDMAEVNQAAGKEWMFVSLNGQPIAAERSPTMKFEGGKVSIFGGVNRLSASYALIDNQSVTLGQLVSTTMAGPPKLMELERAFSQTMARVDAFHVAGNQLDLLSSGQVVASFKSKD